MADNVKCPICGSKTRPRLAKIAGSYFHLCINYPECKGKVAFENEWEEEREEERPVTREIRPRAARTVHGSTRTNSPIKKWLIPAIGIVLVIVIIVLGLYFNNANTRLSDTQNQLSTTQNELDDTQNELTEVQAELNTLRNTDTGEVLTAKATLDQFVQYAKAQNYQGMWSLLASDSQQTYTSESDFEQNNVICQKDGSYVIGQYSIGTGIMLQSWETYSDVAEMPVLLVNELSDIGYLERYVTTSLLAYIPIIGGYVAEQAGAELPDMTVTTWDVHCVKEGNDWKILCDREDSPSLTQWLEGFFGIENSSPSPTSTPTPAPPQLVTISYTSTTTSQIDNWFIHDYPGAGNVYLVVNMSISNLAGPSLFTVYQDTFVVTANNVRYSCSGDSADLGNSLLWNYAGSGGPLNGSLAFEVPEGTTVFSMGYEGGENFTIQWVPQ